MKIRGAELQAWSDAAWPGDDWYWDHDLFDIPAPDAIYDTDDIGRILYQGSGDDPTNGNGFSLDSLIRKWRKARDFDIVTAEVPKTKTLQAVEMLKALGATVNSH